MDKGKWHQPPCCTTLMGCLLGAFDYYGHSYSPAMLYGLTGHAFFINIHKEVCPSGPYAWNHRFLNDLTEQLGMKITESPFMTGETSQVERDEAVERLSSFLEGGNPCMATCLEHQLIEEIRGGEIILAMPWDDEVPSQFRSIAREDLSPCLDKAGFLMFGYFEKVPVEPNLGQAVQRALLAAEKLFETPEKYQIDGYQSGFGAYENWISALQKDKYDEHGHWWNGMVWTECRDMASRFFEELLEKKSSLDEQVLKSLVHAYRVISDRLDEAKEKELEREKKIILLTEALEMEYEAHYLVERLLGK